MKLVIALACLFAVASAVPRPDSPEEPSGHIPKGFRRYASPEEVSKNEANLDDSFMPEPIFISYSEIDPSQIDLNDLMEFVKDASRAFEINPEVIQISDVPLNEAAFAYSPVDVVNSLPEDDAEKVIVVNSPAESNNNDQIPQADMIQVVNSLPEDDSIAQENNDVTNVEIVNSPISDDKHDVIQVASLPVQNDDISSANDEIRAVKFVENPNMEGSENFVGIPMNIAPSELDSLRLDFDGENHEMPLNNEGKISYYPLRFYPDPNLR